MNLRRATLVTVLLVVLFVTGSSACALAQGPVSLLTDKSLYTLRDKQVLLQGSGYDRASSYFVWLEGPGDNSTRNTGLSLVTTETGEIPPGVSLPIQPTSPLGTYVVSLSNSTTQDSSVARTHYGIWGTDKYVYQRTEIIQVRGGGILPKGSIKVTIRNPAGTYVHDTTIAANDTGMFLTSWKIPSDAMTESYSVFIDGTGTYDDPNAEFVSISKLSVTPALLNITSITRFVGPYERTQTVSVDFVIRYPDTTPVVSVKDGLTPVALYAGQFKIADIALSALGMASGVWTAQAKISRNATVDVKYRFLLAATSFDDGKGNTGPEKDVETDGFDVVPATLGVTAVTNASRFQVPFDTVVAFSQVTYPDGTPVANAVVRAWLIASGSRVNTTLKYDETSAAWRIEYTFSLADLLKSGTWTLSVEASDAYANTGSASLQVSAEPYLFLVTFLTAVVALGVVRWLLSRYWRRFYLRTKRMSSAIRDRLKPIPLGRYFSSSPVTP